MARTFCTPAPIGKRPGAWPRLLLPQADALRVPGRGGHCTLADVQTAPLVEYVVEPNYAGWTLAAYVAEKIPRMLPHQVDKMLRGRALVAPEGLTLLPETLLWPGLSFALRKRAIGDDGEPAPLAIVYQDDALLIVDKPPYLALHPTARYHLTTLTRALELYHRNGAGQKPDPAHRLDRDTSGLVACGRSPTETKALKRAFAERQVDKCYLALVEGAPATDHFVVDQPLAVGTERIKVMVRIDPAGAPSLTEFSVVNRFRDGAGRPLALLRCSPRTGRQHQLRAHLAFAGLPLVGDKLYGPDAAIFLRLVESGLGPPPAGEWDQLVTEAERRALRLPRHALHAAELVVPHPATGVRMRFTSPLPSDLQTLISGLAEI